MGLVLSDGGRGRHFYQPLCDDGEKPRNYGTLREICQRNPIVTHRHMPLMSEISVVMQDLVETTRANGGWYCWESVPMKDSTIIYETFLVPVTWDN
ncbi:MAG: hypothetical protein ACLR6I_00715 [Waltera sp.]